SIFWILFTRLPPPALNPMVKLDVLPVVLTFEPDAQLEQVTTLEELKRLFRSTVWFVHPLETMQSFTPRKCWMSVLLLSEPVLNPQLSGLVSPPFVVRRHIAPFHTGPVPPQPELVVVPLQITLPA